MRYDLFVEERYNNSTISGTYKNYLHFVEISLHTQNNNNNLLLIPDLFVRPMVTCLWRYYWLHDLFTQHNSFHKNKISTKKNYLTWNYDTTSWEAWVDSQFWIFLWTLLWLVLTTIEYYCALELKLGWESQKDRVGLIQFSKILLFSNLWDFHIFFIIFYTSFLSAKLIP